MKCLLFFLIGIFSVHSIAQVNENQKATELDELVISTPPKRMKQIKVGKKNEGDLYLFLPRGVEFITEVSFKKRFIGKKIYKIAYPIRYRDIFPDTGKSIMKINIYNAQRQTIYSDTITEIDSTENTLNIIIDKETVLAEDKLYFGIESLDYDNKPYYSNLCFLIDPMYENAYYKETYENNEGWKSIEEIYKKERMKIIITRPGQYNGPYFFPEKYKSSIPAMSIYLKQ